MTNPDAHLAPPPHSLFQPPVVPGRGQRIGWQDLSGSASAAAVAHSAQSHNSLSLIIVADTQSAVQWQEDLRFYLADAEHTRPIWSFPDWETLPYDPFSPHQDIVSERLATLASLPTAKNCLLIAPIRTLLQRLAPRTYIDAYSMHFEVGQQFDIDVQRHKLSASGYQATNTVANRGEYAIRGALMDIFPMGASWPIRIDLMDDEIDSLRTFDAESQRTIEKIEKIELLPAKEFPFDEAAIAGFRQRWHTNFDIDVRRCGMYQDVSAGIPPSGIEYYLPFFFDELSTLFDYLPPEVVVYQATNIGTKAAEIEDSISQRFENLRHDVERPILPPAALYLGKEDLNTALAQPARVILEQPHKHQIKFDTQPIPELKSPTKTQLSFENLYNFLGSAIPKQTLFVAESLGRREVLYELLVKNNLRPQEFDGLQEFRQTNAELGITYAALNTGLNTPDLAIITEKELFGSLSTKRRRHSDTGIDPDQVIKNLTELSINAPVVHIQHGVGRYLGLVTLDIDGNTNEFLSLLYADETKLYVPVTSLHLISRYSGTEEALAPLHRLGSDQWNKAKRKAAERAYDAAAELLNIYARRETGQAHEYPFPAEEYEKFAAQFPFEVTTDQERAIADVIEDLVSPRATDRLICGDVGFGKTEVAMRAAFIAAQTGKQVIVLVPTTLLAQQHYDSFQDRFAGWPIEVAVISRLKSETEIADVKAKLEAGTADIIIGTHRLLNPAFNYKNLGLLVIDEEHRFGVRQKERLKALRAEVDILTLTATPIPRTLNMAMTGLRDLSIIATPPAKRLSIETFVHERRQHLIKDAISRELMRGGQVFYLHNEVRNIEEVAKELQELVPEVRLGIGHGQLPKRQLESVMSDFYHRQLNLLLCTTIIENGIDVPNANTIIIDRADKFGLAQLHQLRGRVGRSNRQAYAYLLTPHPSAITADAVKRLDAIQAAGELGIGFTLATHDMEIRGAGELLGEDQSGQMETVGFSLYMDLLDRAVKAIREGKDPNLDTPLEPLNQEVNLHAATLIPETYLPDVHTRLILYKRIASAEDAEELDSLQAEIIDRFGLLPESVKQLFQVTHLKLIASGLGLLKVDLSDEGGKLEFGQNTSVDPLAVVNLVQSQPNTFKLSGATVLRITKPMRRFDLRVHFAHQLLKDLTTTHQVQAS